MKRIHSLALLSAALVAGISIGATAVFGQATEDAVATGGAFPLAAPAGVDSHAIERARLVHGDIQSVLIAGAGPIGLGVLAMAKLLLGENVPVLLSDVVPYRLKLAEQMGGLPILATEATLADGLRRHGIDAPDIAIDAAGKTAVREECLGLLAHALRLGGCLGPDTSGFSGRGFAQRLGVFDDLLCCPGRCGTARHQIRLLRRRLFSNLSAYLPGLGVRFYGIGNELEALLGVLVVAGTGAGLAGFAPELSRRRAAFAFLGIGLLCAFVFAAGRFGADVGA